MKCPECDREGQKTNTPKLEYCENCKIYFCDEMEENKNYKIVRPGEE